MTEQQPPARWPENVRAAFWTAVNAPTYEDSTTATLAFAHQLAELVREDVDLDSHPGESLYPCEGCAEVRAANLIDPEVTKP